MNLVRLSSQCKPKISFSNHPDRSAKAVKTLLPTEVDGVKKLIDIITKLNWSPIIFKNNQRKQDNFISCDWLAFDFDGGETIEKIKEQCIEWGCFAVIGTTKSHGKEKTTPSGVVIPACDRFRLIMRASTTCTSPDIYDYNMRHYAKFWSVDRACLERGRFYNPCTKVEWFQDGLSIDWAKLPENYKTKQMWEKEQTEKALKYREKKDIPNWIYRAVKYGVPVGSRNIKVYSISAFLTDIGYGPDDIFRFIMSGKLSEVGDEEVRRTVNNAAKRKSRAVGFDRDDGEEKRRV